MKKFFVFAMFALSLAVMSCGNDEKETVATPVEVVATDIVPAAATDVIPCAAPGPDAGGKVATEVIPDSVAQ
jgi:hypothetical protein